MTPSSINQTWKKKETLVEDASSSSGVGKLALVASAFGGAALALALVAVSGALRSSNAPQYQRLPKADYNQMA